MQIDVEPGVYVVAVSGGVDSMALLDLLVKKVASRQSPVTSDKILGTSDSAKRYRFVVAHFDHGIREDSSLDRQLVQKFAAQHGLPFVYHEGGLDPDTSEEAARKARYEFLHRVREAAGAQAILTAHHHDDALETAVHNLLRGTGRKGLSSLSNTLHVKRPLLHIPKDQLKAYAEEQGLKWREDITNEDIRYIRNYIRHNILPRLTLAQKAELLDHIQKARQLNQEIDIRIAKFLQSHGPNGKLVRKKFIGLPHVVAREVMAGWLRQNGIRQFDRKLLERLVIAAKTYAIGKAAHVSRDHYLLIEKKDIVLKRFAG